MKTYIFMALLLLFGIYLLSKSTSSIDDTILVSGKPSNYFIDIGMRGSKILTIIINKTKYTRHCGTLNCNKIINLLDEHPYIEMHTIGSQIWGLNINNENEISFEQTVKNRGSGISLITILLPLLFFFVKTLEHFHNKSVKEKNISSK